MNLLASHPGLTACLLIALVSGWVSAEELHLERAEKKIAVRIGEDLFTEVDLANYARPILYPVLGPRQTPMTRNYPMQKGVAGEATDHPHHKSIWCAHGDINGVSFWHEQGTIRVNRDRPIQMNVSDDGQHANVTFACTYLSPEGETVCTDRTQLSFHLLPGGARVVDWDTTIFASHGELKFGDTKEGMMAIRTHPSLRLENNEKQGVTTANGKAVNSVGGTGAGIWGKPAAWVDYSGKVDGHHVGVAIFDHPKNLRHPTTWHARAYGLVAANPFGLSHFAGKPKGTGDFTVAAGKSVRFRYRFVFHAGDADDAGVAKLFDQFAK